MKTTGEIYEMISKVDDYRKGLAWWDEQDEACCCIIDALLWVVGDRSGKTIDPEEWKKSNEA